MFDRLWYVGDVDKDFCRIDGVKEGKFRYLTDKEIEMISKYFKNIGFNFRTIQNLINANDPVILNLHDDGVGIYENHSVIVFGYTIHKIDNDKEIYTLLIYDNWSKEMSWIIYIDSKMLGLSVYMIK